MNKHLDKIELHLRTLSLTANALELIDDPNMDLHVQAIRNAIYDIDDTSQDIAAIHERYLENEDDLLERNLDYLFDNIDDMEQVYSSISNNHRFNNTLVSDCIEQRLYDADRDHKPTNKNNATTYLIKLINVDYNNYKQGIPSLLELEANGITYNTAQKYVD